MSSPPTLDVEALLGPIAGANPAGESLRYEGTYDAIQDARRADDTLEQGEWVRQTKAADWPAVIEMVTTALATRSKDLQLAVWLVEALVKRSGFAGLRDSLRLLSELLERFWEALYPEIEDGDMEFRAAPLEWLNDKLPPTLRQIPLTRGANGESYAWLRWEESRVVDNLGRRDQATMQAALAEGKITGEQFDAATATTPLEFYKVLFEDLRQGRDACDRLTRLVDDKFGQQAPSLTGIVKVIEDCQALIESILKQRGGLAPEVPPPPQAPAPEPGPADRLPPSPEESAPGRVASEPVRAAYYQPSAGLSLEPQDRADALRRLTAVAAYFRRTEPHSPVSYLIQRAVRWAEMPLEDWLRYVIHDEAVLENLRETLGLKDADHHETTAGGD
jgi:type VI secretion system protein ImpA